MMMTITKAHSRKESNGHVLYGVRPDREKRVWFERWYPSKEAAVKYAEKRGWDYEVKER